MSKRKSKRSRKRTNPPATRQRNLGRAALRRSRDEKSGSHLWKRVLSVIGGAGTLASLLSLLLSFLPQVSVRPEGRLDPQNPFSNPFVISNSGLTGINEVTFLCRLRHATNDQGGKIVAYNKGGRLAGFKISQIAPSESATVRLPFAWIGGTLVSADFDFVLEYRPSYYPLRKEATFRFATAPQQDGTLVWLPRAKAEP
jgi:hypothetical protein